MDIQIPIYYIIHRRRRKLVPTVTGPLESIISVETQLLASPIYMPPMSLTSRMSPPSINPPASPTPQSH